MSDLKNLRTYSSLVEAEAACSYLEAHGIKATLPDRHAIYHQPHLIEVLGGIRMQVSEDKFKEAEELLSAIEKRSHLSSVDRSIDHTTENFQESRRKTSVKWFARLTLGFFVIYWFFHWFKS